MKKTWIHIQDGTRSQPKATQNLVFITKGPTNVSDVLTVSGKVATDRDFGYGCRYIGYPRGYRDQGEGAVK